jgi:PmbA protein
MALTKNYGLGSEALLDAASELVELAFAKESVHEAEAIISLTVNSFVRFADTGPTQSAERAKIDVHLRVRREADGQFFEASAEGQSLDEVAMDKLIEQASSIAAISPAMQTPLELGGPVEVSLGSCDSATLTHGPREKAIAIKRALAAAKAVDASPAGLYDTTGHAVALANSKGRQVRNETSRASFALTVTGPSEGGLGGSGWAETIRSSVGELDIDGTIERAIAKAAIGQERGAVEPGEYTVILEPAAVSSLLLFASYYGFGAKEVAEQSSFLCDRIGTRAFADKITIHDNWDHPMYQTCSFDGEGSPKRVVPLVDAGVLQKPVTDRRFAVLNGGSADDSTGHGDVQPSGSGPSAGSLCVDAGTTSNADLIAGVERGLLITQFHYTNLIDPREMSLTGMTRNGLFLIENGRIVQPLKNLRFTESLLRAMERVTDVGSQLDISGALFDGEVITPALRIDGFRFTSATDF